jgi:hypothetical protein
MSENIFSALCFLLHGPGVWKFVFMHDNNEEYFMHVLADLNYANGKRAAIKVIIKL